MKNIFSNLKQESREAWIDIYKGLAIILVVLGHLEIPQGLYDFIFIFHMYAFFFVSGVTFKVKKEQNFWHFFVDNIKRLYIPYLFFAFAWDATNMVAQFYINRSVNLSALEIIKNIGSVLIGGGPFESSASVGPAWFLLALIIVRCVCWLTVKLSNDNCWIFVTLSIALFTIGYICNGMSFLPFKLFSILTAFIFVFAGYMLKNPIMRLKKISPILLGLCGIVFLGLAFLMSLLADKSLILVSNSLPSNLAVTIVGGGAGCIGILLLSMSLTNIPVLSDWLIYYGINSLVIMGVHSELNFAMRLMLEEFLHVTQAPRTIVIFFATLIMVIPICVIFNRYFPALVGKRKEKRKYEHETRLQ